VKFEETKVTTEEMNKLCL